MADSFIMFPGPSGVNRIYTTNTGNVDSSNHPIFSLLESIDQSVPGSTNAVVNKSAGPFQTITNTQFTSADQSGADATLLPAAGAGLKNVATDITIAVATAMTVTIKEGATVLLYADLAAHSTFIANLSGKIKQPTANTAVLIRTSVAGQVTVGVLGYTEA